MPRTRGPYPAEFRRRIIELARAGRSVAELAKEFEPSYWTIRQWIKQADRDEGRSAEGLSTAEREELRRLRKENRQLKQEREILSKAAAWFARETDSVPPKSLRVRERSPGEVSDCHDVPCAGGLHQRVLRVAPAGTVGSIAGGRKAAGTDRSDPQGEPRHLRSPSDPRRSASRRCGC